MEENPNEEIQESEDSEWIDMPPKAKSKTVRVAVKKEIDEKSTPEEIQFAVQQARACLTAAKRNCTRAFNGARDQCKEDPQIGENVIKGNILLKKAEDRYAELEEAYHELVLLGEDPDDHQELAEETWTQIQSEYIAWLPEVEAEKPKRYSTGRSRVITGGTVTTGYTFDMRKHLKDPFTGTDPRVYQSFRLSWNLASAKMEELGYTDANQLMELKKVTKGQAHNLIRSLPEEDANLQIALDTLDKVYKNAIKVAELAITDFLIAPKVTNTSASVMDAYVAITTAENTLKGMGITKEQIGDLLFAVVCDSKLNNALIKNWEELKQSNSDLTHPFGHTTTREEFNDMILQYYHLLLTYETNKKVTDAGNSPDKKTDEKKKEKEEQKKKGSSTIPGGYSGAQSGKDEKRSGGTLKKLCFACKKEGHWITECKILTEKKSGKDRSNYLKDNNINVCRNCLRGAHPTKQCTKSAQCNLCKEPQFHHPFLHFDNVKGSNPVGKQDPIEKPKEEDKDGNPAGVQAAKSPKQDLKPILQSCQAWLVAPGGERFNATVFLDSGSELTLIRRGLAQEAGLQGKTISFSMAVAG